MGERERGRVLCKEIEMVRRKEKASGKLGKTVIKVDRWLVREGLW